MHERSKHVFQAATIAVLATFVVGLSLWFTAYRKEAPKEESSAADTSFTEPSQDLGTAIFSEVESSSQVEVPNANPTANPIEDFYKNPFE